MTIVVLLLDVVVAFLRDCMISVDTDLIGLGLGFVLVHEVDLRW